MSGRFEKHASFRRWTLRLGRISLFAIAYGPITTPAQAGLELCNATSSRVGIALGYKGTGGWVSEGWWNIDSHTCETLLKGVLVGRYYYIHAVDYDHGGEWAGNDFMCTDDESFTIARDTSGHA